MYSGTFSQLPGFGWCGSAGTDRRWGRVPRAAWAEAAVPVAPTWAQTVAGTLTTQHTSGTAGAGVHLEKHRGWVRVGRD